MSGREPRTCDTPVSHSIDKSRTIQEENVDLSKDTVKAVSKCKYLGRIVQNNLEGLEDTVFLLTIIQFYSIY